MSTVKQLYDAVRPRERVEFGGYRFVIPSSNFQMPKFLCCNGIHEGVVSQHLDENSFDLNECVSEGGQTNIVEHKSCRYLYQMPAGTSQFTVASVKENRTLPETNVFSESDEEILFQDEPSDDCVIDDAGFTGGKDSSEEIEYMDTLPPTAQIHHLDSDDSFNDEVSKGFNCEQRSSSKSNEMNLLEKVQKTGPKYFHARTQ
uniref:DBR1 domain-containing protein n=1 Tax=Angiostrongylus cantonensis TaxID=6313 RepID=A0A0K0D5J3_ANGCA